MAENIANEMRLSILSEGNPNDLDLRNVDQSKIIYEICVPFLMRSNFSAILQNGNSNFV